MPADESGRAALTRLTDDVVTSAGAGAGLAHYLATVPAPRGETEAVRLLARAACEDWLRFTADLDLPRDLAPLQQALAADRLALYVAFYITMYYATAAAERVP